MNENFGISIGMSGYLFFYENFRRSACGLAFQPFLPEKIVILRLGEVKIVRNEKWMNGNICR
jgi:hypothetical protein